MALSISGVHREVVPPVRLVHDEHMVMGPGAGACGPEGDACADGGEPWVLVATLELSESAGATELVMTLRFPTREARDMALASGMEHGVSAGYDTLDGLLVAMAA
jgi:uncharacterized protein YndB with AHSA1/START domain